MKKQERIIPMNKEFKNGNIKLDYQYDWRGSYYSNKSFHIEFIPYRMFLITNECVTKLKDKDLKRMIYFEAIRAIHDAIHAVEEELREQK